ncbi:hypothetical protein BOTBODRAFT_173042 [Botryobasidium botryosum FD-172 SS1]|uniref:F-box domain-containing protein n=1 Tax=Botryobasidium botryosum (strain FD-172 SS1) TaxID=930990 RepID=A0A067MP88_BOTB1|nr:hypothetical protein BOTBODRAFT_173042 [Botryobasidium botryosum FD-172 SS1]
MKAIALPADVVLNIYHLNHYDSDSDSLNLSHVCRLWRDILHGYTAFWAKVDLHLGKRDPDRKAAYWVKRAGRKPLVIHVRCGRQQPVVSERKLTTIIARVGLVLRDCMDRWESFTMDTSSQEIEHLLLICTGYAPRLRVLNLNCWNGIRDVRRLLVPILPSIELPSDSSGLSVSTQGYIPRFTMPSIGITEISVDFSMDWPDEGYFNMNDLFSIFQSCPNLINFHLSAFGSDEMGPPLLNGFVILSRLTAFSLSWIRSVENVLSFLQLPLLESITLFEANWSDAARVALWNVFGSSPFLSSIIINHDDDKYCYERDPVPFHESPLTLHHVTTFHMEGSRTFLQPLLDLLTLPRVEKLELAGAPISTVHRFISSSTELRDVSLRNFRQVPADLDIPAHAPILLPSLTSLHVEDFPAFVDYIHAPRLKTLKLEEYYDSAHIVGSRAFLRAAVERSATALTTLHLRGLDVGDEDMQWCLERLSVLEELFISYCAISDAVLSALASPPSPDANASWLLPCLKTFLFENNDCITPSGAIKFLATRTLNPIPNISGEFGFNLDLSPKDAMTIMEYGSSLSRAHMYIHVSEESGDEL